MRRKATIATRRGTRRQAKSRRSSAAKLTRSERFYRNAGRVPLREIPKRWARSATARIEWKARQQVAEVAKTFGLAVHRNVVRSSTETLGAFRYGRTETLGAFRYAGIEWKARQHGSGSRQDFRSGGSTETLGAFRYGRDRNAGRVPLR